jgi:hypothetical protein
MRIDASCIKDNETIVAAHDGSILDQRNMFLSCISVDGDLLQQVSFLSPYVLQDPEASDYFIPTDMKIPENNEILTVSAIESGLGNGFNTYLAKHSSSGSILWDVVFEAELGAYTGSINILDSGFIICYGEVNIENDELIDKWIVQFDDGGAETWIKYQTGLIVDHAEESVYSNGLVTIVSGLFYDGTPSQLPVIYQVDLMGNLQWLTYLDVDFVNNIEQYYLDIIQTSEGGFVAGGVVYNSQPQNPEQNGDFNWDAVMTKYSQDGTELWTPTYN